jgi:hypothetical protein
MSEGRWCNKKYQNMSASLSGGFIGDFKRGSYLYVYKEKFDLIVFSEN